MRWHRRALVVLALLLVAGCGPGRSAAPPGPSLEVFTAINEAFGPYDATGRALQVAKCESGWVPTAGAGEFYQGLFQLGPHIVAIHQYGGDFLDPVQNAAAARDLWLSRGKSWSAWPVCGR
ncbi:MAG: hypothetical protein FJW86_00085 [Actinobacteria bacterium]|nr:hypothetical protein [Actinomycetota bacterium]